MEQVKQKPWLIRTYAGHSSAKASNELYRKNLQKGQTANKFLYKSLKKELIMYLCIK